MLEGGKQGWKHGENPTARKPTRHCSRRSRAAWTRPRWSGHRGPARSTGAAPASTPAPVGPQGRRDRRAARHGRGLRERRTSRRRAGRAARRGRHPAGHRRPGPDETWDGARLRQKRQHHLLLPERPQIQKQIRHPRLQRQSRPRPRRPVARLLRPPGTHPRHRNPDHPAHPPSAELQERHARRRDSRDRLPGLRESGAPPLLPAFALSAIGDGMSAVGVAWLAIRIAAPADRDLVVGVAVAAYTLPGAAGAVLLARPLRGLSEPAPRRRRRDAARGDAEHDPDAVRVGRSAGRGRMWRCWPRLRSCTPGASPASTRWSPSTCRRSTARPGTRCCRDFDGRLRHRPAAGRPGSGGCRARAAGCRRRRVLRDPCRRRRHGEGAAKDGRGRGCRRAGPGPGVRGDRPQPGAGRAARPDRGLLLPVRAGRGGAAAVRDRAAARQRRAARPVLDRVRYRCDHRQHRRRGNPPPSGLAGPGGGGDRLGCRARPAGPAAPARPRPGLLRRRRPALCALSRLVSHLVPAGEPAGSCSPRSWPPAAR